eukprot:g3273.t1
MVYLERYSQASESSYSQEEIQIEHRNDVERDLPEAPLYIKSPPLSFFDNYTITGGIPTFSFKTEGNENRQFGNVFAISSDTTKLALSKNEQQICVCSLLDYSTIAEGANLVANDDSFVYLAFMDDFNEELVAITQRGKILFISTLTESGDQTSEAHGQQRELVATVTYQVDDSFREEESWHFIAEVSREKLWLVEWTTEGTIALRVSRISRQYFQPVKIYSGLRRTPSEVRLSTHARAVMAMFLWMYEPQRNYTALCSGIDFAKRELYQTPNKILGKCIAQDNNGMYFLFWRYYDDGRSALKLYSNESMNSESPEPIVSRSLGKGMSSVKATFLDRAAWPFEKIKESSDEETPLVCVLAVRPSGIAVLAWDSHSKRILKEIDTKMKGLRVSQRSQIEFCVSPNLRWFAVGCWKDAIIGLFSFVSGVQVWSVRLDLVYVSSPMFLPFTFDQSSSKLIVNSKKELFVFLPPCLVDDYKIEYRSLSYDLSLDWEVSFSNVDIYYQRLISQRFLFSLLIFNFDLEDDNGRIAIASSQFSSKIAVVVYNEEELSLVIATWEQVFSFAFRDWLKATMSSDDTRGEFSEVKHDFDEVKINKELSSAFGAKLGKCHVMLYPSKDKTSDSVALFSLTEGVNAIFIDLDTNSLEFFYLDEQEWFGFTQSTDGLRATCFRNDGILIIDLENKMVLKKIHYEVDLIPLLYAYRREQNLEPWKSSFRESSRSNEYSAWISQTGKYFSSPTVSPDGNSILLGWDTETKQPILVTSMTSKEEIEMPAKLISKVVPCWALDEALEKFAFLEFDEPVRNIKAIGVYNRKSKSYRRLDRASWTPHMARVLDSITTKRLLTFGMHFDEGTGYLWMTSIVRNSGKSETLILLPIGPYSTEGCVPCLYMQDYPSQDIHKEQLVELESQFGCALHDMPFNGMTNVHLCLTHKDVNMIGAISRNANEYDVEIALTVLKEDVINGFHNLLEFAIYQQNESVVNAILEILGEHLAPFISSSYLTKRCFENLWKGYRKAFERLLKKDLLYWDFTMLEVPSDVFTDDDYLGARVGTCSEVWPWNNSNNKDASSEYWRASHERTVKDIEKKGSLAQVTALLKIFCIDDVCKVGLNGIVRFLVTHEAPSRIYKCSLVRWCITWKWEHIWKSYSLRSFIYYIVFLGVFSAYAILVGMYGNKMHEEKGAQILLTVPLSIASGLALTMVPQEINQITTYTQDGRKLFPEDPFWGVKYYLSSRWNLVESLTCIILLLIILPLHIISFFYPSCVPCLYVVMAVECIIVWLKIWYYAQAFAETGALVLMIENVIRDCLFFLLLSGVILVAFGISLFIMFQHAIRHHDPPDDDDDEDETFETIKSSFEQPQKVLLTLFYAMIGEYETEVYSASGTLSPFIVFTFVLYLSIQSIVMFNMLIAIMSDTYDRVKSTEEEQLLMGRARFIDACEAALNKNQIKKLESDIGKYLYVIVPKDDDLSDEMTLWQGRVKTIEENVRKIVTESQATIMENMRRDIKLLEDNLESNINTLEENMRADMSTLEDNMKRDMQNLEDHMRKDVTHLQTEVKQDVTNLKTKMNEDISSLEENMKQDVRTFEERMKTDITQLQVTMKEDVGTLETNMKGEMSLMEGNMQGGITTLQQNMNSDIGNLKEYMTGDIGNLKDSVTVDMNDLHGNMKEDTYGLERTMKEDISRLKEDMKSLISMVETQIQAENLATKQQLEMMMEYFRGGTAAEEHSASTRFEDLDY